MCDQTEIEYLDGDVVWVKLGSCWWPGEVVGPDRLPPDVLTSFRKPPIAVVKFFQETTYEYVKNINCIYKYNCSRKNEFINKGLYMYRTKHGHMEKFPEDVIRAETAVGGDIEILTRDEFQEIKKESYAGIFGDTPKKTPVSGQKGRGRRRLPSESRKSTTPIWKSYIEKTDYKAHILVQASTPIRQSTETRSTPPTSRAGSEIAEENPHKVDKVQPPTTSATPTASSSGFVPYTPSPVRKKLSPKSSTKTTTKSPKTTKALKTSRPRKDKSEKTTKSSSSKKRSAEDKPKNVEVKKPRTEQEIKSSLLADWDDVDEESVDEFALPPSGSPEAPAGAEAPAATTPTTPAELPSAHVPSESSSLFEKKPDEPPAEKPESSNDSKYEFCEDEDWPVEADVGRKIPRIKPSKRREEAKSVSLDDDDVAKEVAELLTKTTVPELPSVPEPLKAEENFPEPPVVKSPDKKPENKSEATNSENTTESKPTKAIFKTKTFFRSRHSRSQDAIGKYVAEQLNAAERMDMNESEINGAETVSSPETRDSSPVELVKVARLAPKIQLKKMKAEAAQLEEKEKNTMDQFDRSTKMTELKTANEMKNTDKILQDALYPAQVIKPVNKEIPDKLMKEDSNEPVNKEIPDNLLNEESKDQSKIIQVSNEVKTEEIVAKTETDIESTLSKKYFSPSKIIEESPKSFKNAARRITRNATDEHVAVVKMSSNDNTHEAELQKVSEPISKHPVPMDVDHGQANTEITETLNKASPKRSSITSTKDSQKASPLKPSGTSKISFASKIETVKSFEQLNELNMCESSSITSLKNSPNTSPLKSLGTSKKSFASNNETVKSFEQLNKPDMSESSCITPSKNSHNNCSIKSCGTPKKTSASKIEALKSFEQLNEPYMSESTASAVDALLSVSREADRVTRIVSDDLPEDLFEDDNKEGTNNDNVISESAYTDIGVFVDQEIDQEKCLSKENDTHLNDRKLSTDEMVYKQENDLGEKYNISNPDNKRDNFVSVSTAEKDNIPSESDLQIAEALINLPSTTMQNKSGDLQDNVELETFSSDPFVEEVVATTETDIEPIKTCKSKENDTELTSQQNELSNNEALNIRYETEQEKSENLNAAQSLVQMSESIDPTVNPRESNELVETKLPEPCLFKTKQNNGIDFKNTVEHNVALLASENKNESSNIKSPKFETTSSKLLKILEEPPLLKSPVNKPATPVKQLVVTGKEKILNFDVAKAPKGPAPKQKIIIRRSATSKTIINNLKDVITSPDKIILSRNTVQDGSAIQTFTIQTTADSSISTITTNDPKQIIIHPKIRKVTKSTNKVPKIKAQNSLISDICETKPLKEEPTPAEEPMFDINSMPVVLSDDILTPENIDKMPIVMSDGNIITNTSNPPKLVKTKPVVENEKIVKSASPSISDVKTLIMNSVSDVNKVTTPNILSKSSKIRGAKPMLVIDKATGKQKIIMTKGDPVVKEIKQAPSLIQAMPHSAPNAEKFILLPSASSPRPGRTQKIVIDPQTGKAHVLVTKGQETPLPVPENKPVSAKLIPSSSDASSPGNTVMIITNAQGAQSRIVLTPEHEKILFPNKQPNVSQLKTITHRISTTSGVVQKTVVTTAAPTKTQTRIVPKQKSAIITSKGQLIVGGRVATTAQNIAPMPEIRPATTKRIIATEPKKLIQAVQKNASEPLIFLQQKSGAVMQLTAAQFEHLQRTGQIVQKTPAPVQDKQIVLQKSLTISSKETITPIIQKHQRLRKTVAEATTPAKRAKQDISIALAPVASPAPAAASAHVPVSTPALLAPAPLATSPLAPPPLAPFAASVPTITITPMVPDVSNTVSVGTSSAYPDLDNFEEMLPSTAIARQPEPVAPPEPEPEPESVPPAVPDVTCLEGADPGAAAIADNQLLAVPGETLGGLPGAFYLCIEENGKFTPIDNRPLILENSQLVPMALEPAFAPQPERRDILEAALANSDVFQAEASRDVPAFRDLNANVSVHCRVSETSTTLNQPIMTPVEVPTKGEPEPAVPPTLEAGLAVIGVTPHTVPTSLELPITVTDPRIAPKTTDPLRNSNYGTALLPSPNAETFVTSERAEVAGAGGISMPLLADEDAVGKSMPLLTDEVAVSSVESAGSPCSPGARGEDGEGGARWSRRLLPPASDSSDNSANSAEIPLQPALQLSASDLAQRHS